MRVLGLGYDGIRKRGLKVTPLLLGTFSNKLIVSDPNASKLSINSLIMLN